MDKENKIELHIPSVPGSEKIAMDHAAAVARRMGFSGDRIEDLKTAVAEACINAMEHGNKMDADTKVAVTLSVTEEKLQVDVRDAGKGIGDVSSPDIDRKAPQPDLQGKIIMAEERNTVIGDHVMAFIDRGEKDGVRTGQRYSIFYQETGELTPDSNYQSNLDTVDYGELIVVHTEDSTSTVYITKTNSNIIPGALVRTPFR